MPKIIILPHHELCPEGDIIEAKKGTSVCDALLSHDIHINTHVTRSVLVPPAMSLCAKGFNHLILLMKMKMICSIKLGGYHPNRDYLARPS